MEKYERLFWDKVDKKGIDECWNWTGCLAGKGYGYAWYCGKHISAHRLSWTIKNGLIPEDMQILHKCDNKKCVNPDHLYCGTHLDNVVDAIERSPTGSTTSKFNVNDIVNIRHLYSIGNTQQSLATKYNCSPSYIGKIVTDNVKMFKGV